MSTRTLNKSLGWKFSTLQNSLYESDARHRVGMLGRRFGKNEVATAEVIDYAVQPDTYDYGADADPVIWWVGNTYTQTQKYGFQKVLAKLPDPLIAGEPKRSAPFEIHLRNGSVIEFYSYDRPASLQGAGVDFMVVDEAAYMPERIWDNDLRPMLLDNNGGSLMISKPLGENWFYDLYTRGAPADAAHSKPENHHDGWYAVHGTSYDNPWIDDAEIDTVKATTPEQVFRQQYLADPQSGGTLLTLDMLDTVSADVLEGQNWEWHVSVDLGVEMSAKKARENDTDFWALAVVAEHPRKPQAYLCEVQRRRGQAPSQAAQWINEVTSWVPTNRVKYEKVAAQAWFEQHLQDQQLTPVPHTPQASKEDRIIGLSVPFSNRQVQLLDWSGYSKDVDWSDFRTEWAGFPGGKVDQLDAVAQALDDVTFGGSITGEGLDIYGRDIDE